MSTSPQDTRLTGLRSALQRITTDLVDEQLDQQVRAVEKLRRCFGHSITLVERANPDHEYTCFQYAFELQVIPCPISNICRIHDVYPDSRFVEFLLQSRLQHVASADARAGDVIIWNDNNRVRHAGRRVEDGIVSKWGTGHIWRHDLFEVPSAYGDTATSFHPLTSADSLDAFVIFARQQLGDDAVSEIVRQ
ncbi:MAG: hypothetical protein WCG85_03220 [Polyangia bacterium]